MHPGRPDWVGFVLLTAGLVSLVYGLTRAGETSWGDTGVIVFLSLATGAVDGICPRRTRRPAPDVRPGAVPYPPFVGGLVAAFTMNGSLFAMFLYLVLHLRDMPGYSAMATGLRLLASTGGLFVAAAVSGRLSERVPGRYLIEPGLAMVGACLWLMTGLSGTSSWAHLLPGLVVAGVGAGLVNPPLASTAVGVVAPERAGMASGVNSTFRQVGFATAIAALGSVFATTLQRHLEAALSLVPALSRQAPQTVALIRQGNAARAINAVVPTLRRELAAAVRSSFAAGVDDLLVVTAVVAFAGALVTFVLVRERDFLQRRDPGELHGDEPRHDSGTSPSAQILALRHGTGARSDPARTASLAASRLDKAAKGV